MANHGKRKETFVRPIRLVLSQGPRSYLAMRRGLKVLLEKGVDKSMRYAEEQIGAASSTPKDVVYTITKDSAADPFVMYTHGLWHLMFTTGGSVEIWTNKDLLDFPNYHQKHVLWVPPQDQPYSADIWAPEFHDIYGRWYAYFAAAHPAQGNRSHRTYVLEGPPSDAPPTSGPWKLLGPVNGMDTRQWSIDSTVVKLNGGLYLVYSGWPIDNPSGREDQQEIWIVGLEMPTQTNSAPVRLCAPVEHWECSGNSGVCEGPQWLESPDGSWKGIVYSCAGSWTKDYKMNALHYLGGDPLNPRSWQKGRPFLTNSRDGRGPFGPGHGTFVNYGGETVAVFHATDNASDGWANRKARVQRVRWTPHGPDMGGVVGNLVERKEAWLRPGGL